MEAQIRRFCWRRCFKQCGCKARRRPWCPGLGRGTGLCKTLCLHSQFSTMHVRGSSRNTTSKCKCRMLPAKSINTTGEMVPSPRTTYPSPARPRQEPRRGQHHGTETAAGTRTQEHNGTSRSASGGTPRPAPAGQAAGARHRARAGQAAHAHKPPASRGRARGPRGCNHRARWVVETNLAPVPLHGTFSNTSISTAMENTSISTAL
jgi:hypothetical protein